MRQRLLALARLLFGQLAVGDVAMHRQPHLSITVVIDHRHGRLAPARRALFGAVMNLALPRARLHAIGAPSRRVPAREQMVEPVSYTQLRAHETKANLE